MNRQQRRAAAHKDRKLARSSGFPQQEPVTPQTPISDAQLTANRANAQFSCGPKAEVGRAVSSQNRTTHGLASCLRKTPMASKLFEALKALSPPNTNPPPFFRVGQHRHEAPQAAALTCRAPNYRLRFYNQVVEKSKDKESGVFGTVLDWVINDDHYEGVNHETGSRYEEKNHETGWKDKDSDNNDNQKR